MTGLYGRPFNGYMGILTAYPTKHFDVQDVTIDRLSDTYKHWPRIPKESSLSKFYQNYIRGPLQSSGILDRARESHWTFAKRRFNVLLSTTLQEKATDCRITVGNYHMPCAFYAPKVMVLHADMAAGYIQRVSAAQDSHGILAGDFNLKPQDAVYQYLVSGELESSDESYPTAFDAEQSWVPVMTAPVRSAYAVRNQEEPNFTNYAKVRDDPAFIDTLDYIFLTSDAIEVTSVHELPHRDDSNGPFPNAEEPSDHIMIAADLQIKS